MSVARVVFPEQVARAVYPAQVPFDINAVLNFVFILVIMSVMLSMVSKIMPS